LPLRPDIGLNRLSAALRHVDPFQVSPRAGPSFNCTISTLSGSSVHGLPAFAGGRMGRNRSAGIQSPFAAGGERGRLNHYLKRPLPPARFRPRSDKAPSVR
jgi:hypothetical protein